tara:strand:- start:3790 stop:4044 length:255 start_codon:yes stop_codon:yes gene_type:complete
MNSAIEPNSKLHNAFSLAWVEMTRPFMHIQNGPSHKYPNRLKYNNKKLKPRFKTKNENTMVLMNIYHGELPSIKTNYLTKSEGK